MLDFPGVEPPSEIRTFLNARGWTRSDSNGLEGWFYGASSELMGFTWEQAVAYEYYRFVTLGGVNGQDAS